MRTLIITALAGLLTLVRPLPGQEAVTLADGARVYSQSCGRCHNPRAPNERSDREWDVITAHMRTRANLSGRETRAVLLFLQTTNGVEGDGGGAGPAATQFSGMEGTAVYVSTLPDAGRVARGPNAEALLSPFPRQTDGLVEEGRKLMEAKACIACHTVGKHKSGVLGPDLNTVFQRRTEDWVMKKLTDPRTDNSATVMPQMNLTAGEREAIVAYLRSVAKK